LAFNTLRAQQKADNWQKEFEDDLCECVSEMLDGKEQPSQETVKGVVLSCFMRFGEKYQEVLVHTAEKENVSPEDIGRRIGVNVATKCPTLLQAMVNMRSAQDEDVDLAQKAEVLMEEGNYKEAEIQFNSLLKIYGTDAGLYNLRGVSRMQMSDFWGATADFRRALELDSTNAVYRYNMGQILADYEFYEESLPFLQNALVLDDSDIDIYAYLGYSYYNLAKYDSAEVYLQQLLKLDADNSQGLNLLGLVVQEFGKIDAAVQYFDKAIETKPDYATPYQNLAQLYYDLGEYQIATQVLNSYKGYNSDLARVKATFAREQKEYANAISNYLMLKDKEEANSADLYYLAYSYQENKDYQQAADIYEETLLLRPEDSDVYSGLGLVLLEQEKYKRAKAVLDKLIEIEPEDAYNYDLRARYFEAKKMREEALADLATSAKLHPNDAQVYINQGRILLDLKRKEEACVAFRQAADIDPELAAEKLQSNCK
jgi:tetratricopeptide (TPR) repeat protein